LIFFSAGVQVKFPFDEELNKKVSIWEGDITTLEIDIVVNAANSSLFWGGGGTFKQFK